MTDQLRRHESQGMLRIAVPNKGSLAETAAQMLWEAGYTGRRDPRDLHTADPRNGVEFFYLRPRDIATYVGSGALDVGITGRDLLLDSGSDAAEIAPLGFGDSTFRFAGPAGALHRPRRPRRRARGDELPRPRRRLPRRPRRHGEAREARRRRRVGRAARRGGCRRRRRLDGLDAPQGGARDLRPRDPRVRGRAHRLGRRAPGRRDAAAPPAGRARGAPVRAARLRRAARAPRARPPRPRRASSRRRSRRCTTPSGSPCG